LLGTHLSAGALELKNMYLEIQQRVKEGITILDLYGKLVLGSEDLLLREWMLSLLTQGVHNIILNLERVSTIDTAGLGTLVNCAGAAGSCGGKVALVSLVPAQDGVLNILQLNIQLEVYSEEADAVNSFFPGRRAVKYDILDFVENLKGR